MDSEEKLRQEAIRLYLQKESISSIAFQLSRSRQWVYKWLKKYQTRSSPDWYKEQSRAPKYPSYKTNELVAGAIVNIRKQLSAKPYSQQGAVSIMYELKRLGFTAPSVATINRILKKHNLIKKDKPTFSKSKEYPTHYYDVQQMDLIGPRYLKGGFKYYIFTIIDINNHMGDVYPIANKAAKSITPCIVDFWSYYQMPDYLQMDNELSFRGSNRHPRGLGLLLRVAVSNNVAPIFIPPAEPWRNGIIEKFNDNVQKYFLSQTFTSLEEMRGEAKEFFLFHNANHRYSSQNNKTPNELRAQMKYLSKLTKEVDINQKPLIEEGKLIFIRFIRSDLKLHLLNSTFIVSESLIYSYVEAIVQIDKHLLIVKHKEKVYHFFEFIMPLS